jgi:NADPH:quinone reductase-like Zn-dependent oxidoreductase
MRALQIKTYGNNDVLEINEISKPSLRPNQLLIEINSASINAIDWKFRSGYLQAMGSVVLPVTLGSDFSGTVVEAGSEVTDFKAGDEVYGQAIIFNGGSGTMAEYVASNAENTALKPKSASHDIASALPLVGVSALQALEEIIKLQKDQKILIHGGAGGIGHIAIQLAKSLGAYVATTVRTEDVEFAKEMGADEVIDYTKEKFEERINDFDAVFDTVGGEIVEKSFQVLKRGGIIASMVGEPNKELAEKFEVKAVGVMTMTTTERLTKLAQVVDEGKIKVHVDKIFNFDQAKEAFEYQEKNHPKGKVVIKIKV